MRIDTYFLTSSAPRVFAVRRASLMSSLVTSFVFRDNKLRLRQQLLVYTQKICQYVVRTAQQVT